MPASVGSVHTVAATFSAPHMIAVSARPKGSGYRRSVPEPQPTRPTLRGARHPLRSSSPAVTGSDRCSVDDSPDASSTSAADTCPTKRNDPAPTEPSSSHSRPNRGRAPESPSTGFSPGARGSIATRAPSPSCARRAWAATAAGTPRVTSASSPSITRSGPTNSDDHGTCANEGLGSMTRCGRPSTARRSAMRSAGSSRSASWEKKVRVASGDWNAPVVNVRRRASAVDSPGAASGRERPKAARTSARTLASSRAARASPPGTRHAM